MPASFHCDDSNSQAGSRIPKKHYSHASPICPRCLLTCTVSVSVRKATSRKECTKMDGDHGNAPGSNTGIQRFNDGPKLQRCFSRCVLVLMVLNNNFTLTFVMKRTADLKEHMANIGNDDNWMVQIYSK